MLNADFAIVFPAFFVFLVLQAFNCNRTGIDIGKSVAVEYTLFVMKVRSANIIDAKAIYSLITYYAEQDKMLFRSMADIYEDLQDFLVAEADCNIVGCCCLQIIWSDLAEIKSLAVDQASTGLGVGKALVDAAVERACQLGVLRVFALTLEPYFFEKMSFKIIAKETLPEKVWKDCARCPKQDNCDETAVIKTVSGDR
jgi:amino-acid N-acetyltransferase